MVVVVDDLTLASNCSSLLLSCKSDPQSELEISDMGEIHWLLGVEIKRNRHMQTMTLSQKAYIDANPATTPMEARAQLTYGSRNEPQPDYPYKEIVRSLMHTATAT